MNALAMVLPSITTMDNHHQYCSNHSFKHFYTLSPSHSTQSPDKRICVPRNDHPMTMVHLENKH